MHARLETVPHEHTFVCVKVLQIFEQLITVVGQDLDNWCRLVWICDKDLEHMKGLKLDGSGCVLKQHHHLHKMLHLAHKPNHDLDTAAVQQQLTKQLRTTCINKFTSAASYAWWQFSPHATKGRAYTPSPP
eukprot:351955-Chlamydomonas_euryale.AAC.15